jgi:S1-C subfamily serine protease
MKYWLKVAIVIIIGTLLYSCVNILIEQPVTVQVKDSLPGIIQRVKPSVVHIRCPEWQGSGFIVSEHLIVTARHVVEGVEDFEITTDDGHKLHTTRAISSKKYDIGFIWVEEPMPVPLELGSIKDCRLGDTLVAIGSPFGIDNFNSVTQGILSAEKRDFDHGYTYGWGWSTLFQTDANGEGGNSGCPLFNTDGKVVGVLVGSMSNGIVYCVPSDVFAKDLGLVELIFLQGGYQNAVTPR